MPGTPLPRSEFPVTHEYAFLNNAGVGPLPAAACEAITGYLDDMRTRGSLATDDHLARVEQVRRGAADLLGVPADDVAFVRNTTSGLGLVASGLDWQPGDRVVVPDLEFPSNVYPWLALRDRGVTVDLIQPVGPGRTLPLELFDEALAREPARLVAVSWVQFGRGWRVDLAGLARLCHERGALLCVDAIQGLGVLPARFREWGVDFASADGHKWLLGPEGVGVFYVAAERRPLLRPLEPGWNSVAHRRQWDNLDLVLDESARRFEGGTQPVGLIFGLGASIDLLRRAGPAEVWRHVEHLTAMAADGLARVGAEVLSERSAGRSGILSFEVPGRSPERVCAALLDRGVVTSPRGGGVRVSPHGYTDESDIDALVAAACEVADNS
ncbi:MAG: aminotransferase class V-fold PLP-dependent enzyme [Actinomycetota bacterium]|nr:aminotransferase class V-fold PLP-dependent enzyme [Actinomycetota bacterium]